MRFETSQHMKLGQHMKLAPRMIQSMEILQMPLAELEERVEQELESNVTLELGEVEADPEAARARAEDRRDEARAGQPMEVTPSGQEDFQRLDAFDADNPGAIEAGDERPTLSRDDLEWRAPRAADEDRDSKQDAMNAAPARTASLVDQLLEQWRLADVAETLRAPGEHLISFLDQDGYLRTDVSTVADRAPAGLLPAGAAGVELVEQALRALQGVLDPPGVAARDTRECLLLQLQAISHGEPVIPGGSLDVAMTLVRDHLDDLAQNRLPKIASRTGFTLDQIKAGLGRLRTLSLAPARALVQESSPPIMPDAIVEYDPRQERFVAYLTDSRYANLQVNREYAHLARDRALEKRDREFIRTNLSNAKWLIDALQQRRQTLLRVISVVADAQADFFAHGPSALKPLPMTAVADQLGIHVATVSRAVSEKWIQTPHGAFPLRGFFSGGLQTESGQDMSYDAARAALKEIIDAEDKANPLSDEALVKEMKAKGIEIARRTVAKYRDQLGIAPARRRKAF